MLNPGLPDIEQQPVEIKEQETKSIAPQFKNFDAIYNYAYALPLNAQSIFIRNHLTLIQSEMKKCDDPALHKILFFARVDLLFEFDPEFVKALIESECIESGSLGLFISQHEICELDRFGSDWIRERYSDFGNLAEILGDIRVAPEQYVNKCNQFLEYIGKDRLREKFETLGLDSVSANSKTIRLYPDRFIFILSFIDDDYLVGDFIKTGKDLAIIFSAVTGFDKPAEIKNRWDDFIREFLDAGQIEEILSDAHQLTELIDTWIEDTEIDKHTLTLFLKHFYKINLSNEVSDNAFDHALFAINEYCKDYFYGTLLCVLIDAVLLNRENKGLKLFDSRSSDVIASGAEQLKTAIMKNTDQMGVDAMKLSGELAQIRDCFLLSLRESTHSFLLKISRGR